MPNFKYPNNYDDDFINTFKKVLDYLNEMGYTYEESLRKAHEILDEAQQTNDMNESVQQQINTLIAESGTSDAEVLQARIDAEGNEYQVLKERLDEKEKNFSTQLDRFDAEMDKTRGELDNLGTTTFTRGEDHTLISIETPTSNININYDINNIIESIEEHRERNNIRTTVNRDDEGVIQSYNREEF